MKIGKIDTTHLRNGALLQFKALVAVLVIACGVWAQTINGVSYIDANGAWQTADGVTVIDSPVDKKTLNAGWYLMRGKFTSNGTITVDGAVHLILEESSNVTVKGADDGIKVSVGNSLSIYAQSTNASTMGELTVTGGSPYAAIGANSSNNGGTVIITGGKVTATGNSLSLSGVGIGGSKVMITGGIVTATSKGSDLGYPGIGGKEIIITGGTVTASSGKYSAGIGGSYKGDGGTITISGGTVTATGGYKSSSINGSITGGAGIGGGYEGGGYTITITEGTVTATGDYGAGIGSGKGGSASEITINGGTVTAIGGSNSAGIGSGGGITSSAYDYIGSEISISGGTVTATGGSSGAGIGGGDRGSGGTITISGGTVTATSGNSTLSYGGAGIGGGSNGNGGTIIITGGTVTAAGGGNNTYLFAGAGIGGGSGTVSTLISSSTCGDGQKGNGGTVIITGGTVTATGGNSICGSGAGIGGGNSNSSGTFRLDGDAVVLASSVDAAGTNLMLLNGTLFIIDIGTKTIFAGTPIVAHFPKGVTATWERDYWSGKSGIYLNYAFREIPGTTVIDRNSIDASYIDENGITKTANNVAVIDGANIAEIDNLSGWFLVRGNLDRNATLNISGTTHLILENSSNLTVKGNSGNAGINVLDNLNIYAQSTDATTMGKLTGTGGNITYGGGSGGAGINGTIAINGGTITATGGSGTNSVGGAGIGGNGKTVTISGGIVTATGSGSGAGISGTFTLNGNAVVSANSVSDDNESRRTGGILFVGSAGKVYGNVEIKGNLTIKSGNTLAIPAGATLAIPSGITLTNYGTVTPANGSTVTATGTVTSSKIVSANVSVPTLASRTATSITINAASLLAATGQTIEYAKNTTNTVPASGWQTGTTFTATDLNTSTAYYIFARAQANTNFAAGTAIVTKRIPLAANLNFTIPTGHIYNGEPQGIGNVTAKISGLGTITAVLYNGNSTLPTKVGTYNVTVNVAESDEFVASSGIVLGEYKIATKSVPITGLSASDKEYDGDAAATIIGTATISGKVSRDDVTIIPGTASFNNKNAENDKTVTFSGFSLGGADVSNYTLLEQPANVTANITAKPLTITGVTASNKVYDGNATATITGTATINEKISGDAVTIKIGNALFNNKDAGNGKAVTFNNFALEGEDASNYTLSAQPASVTANITIKSVTITGISARNKVYDGNETATITGTAVVNGTISGDVVTIIDGSASFNNKNVGTGKPVTFANFALDGADASNYALSAQPANAAANITPKSVTITGISARNKTYDGNANATIAGTAVVNGTISGDNVSVTNGTASFTDVNAGTGKTVTFANFALNGTDANNYALSAQPANVTANITAKPVTITGITALDKVYDGTTTAIITGTAKINEKIGDDEVTVISGTASFANKNVGTSKAIVFNGYRLTGADADNYVLSAQPSGTANITAKPITITVKSITATSREYDGTTDAEVHGNVSISGEISGDNVTIVKGNASFNDKNVGTNKPVAFSGFSLSGTDVNNYTVSVYEPISITANITAKPITITGVTATDRAYNGATTVTLTGGTLVGLKSGDAVGFTLGTGTITTPNVGNGKAVTTNITLTGTDAGNYSLTQPTNVTVSITPSETGISSSSSNVVSSSSGTSSSSSSSSNVVSSSSETEISSSSSNVVSSSSGTSSSSSSSSNVVSSSSETGISSSSSSNVVSSSSETGISSSSSSNVVSSSSGTNISSSSGNGNSSSSEKVGSSSSSNESSTFSNRENPQIGRIGVQTINNAILLSNLPQNAKVEVYNLQGKRIYSANPENDHPADVRQRASSERASKILTIGVQTKGIYIVKIGTQTMRVAVR
jgi:trimeric autotransporter adhesin